jgi:ACS family hexuronate transporter-like MFS transporter
MLERTHSYSVLFILAASVYLLALLIMRLLAPGLKPVELSA